jgi:hypothetical protein
MPSITETAAVSAVAEVETPQPGGAGCGTLLFCSIGAGKLASMTLDPFYRHR